METREVLCIDCTAHVAPLAHGLLAAAVICVRTAPHPRRESKPTPTPEPRESAEPETNPGVRSPNPCPFPGQERGCRGGHRRPWPVRRLQRADDQEGRGPHCGAEGPGAYSRLLGWHVAGRCLQCGLQVGTVGGRRGSECTGGHEGQWNPPRKQIPKLGRRAVLASSVAGAWDPACSILTEPTSPYLQGVGVELVTVGNKGSTYFKKRQPGSEGKGVKTTVRASYACGQGPTAEEATTIANEARRRLSHVAPCHTWHGAVKANTSIGGWGAAAQAGGGPGLRPSRGGWGRRAWGRHAVTAEGPHAG